MATSVVLLSSGLDSTVNLYHFHTRGEVALALTFDYGQRSAQREIEHAARLCSKLDIAHEVVELNFFKTFKSSSLFSQSGQDVPIMQHSDLDSAVAQTTAKSVWVPNRNGLFLNLAACYAEEIGAYSVVAGFNKEEAVTFPDNSAEFLDSLNHCLQYSTRSGVRVQSCTLNWNKREIVQYGQKIGVDFDSIWPCYKGEESPCGQCESCQRYVRAIKGVVTDKRFAEVSA
jgi:7-cyano-7-deazaguanine synthase